MPNIWTDVTTFYRKMVFRPMSTPAPGIPLGVRSAGHYRFRSGETDRKMIKDFVQLFWSVEGSGTLALKGRNHTLKPGMVAFYFPGDIHDIRATPQSKVWEYRWLTLDGEHSLPIIKGFKFGNGHAYYAGAPPVALFEKLADCLRDVTLNGEIEAGAIAFDLLSQAAAAARPWRKTTADRKMRPPPSRRIDAMDAFKLRAIEAIQRHWAEPAYGIEQIAAEVGLHRSVFSRKFHTAFELSPSDYLLRWRIQNALNLLRNSTLPIAKVARSCGWEDPNYFARCISKATGMPPSEFRRIGFTEAPTPEKRAPRRRKG